MSEFNLSVSESAISAEQALANSLDTHPEQVGKEISALKDAFTENKEGLGAHADEIQKLLEDMGEMCDSAGILVKKLVLKLQTDIMFRRSRIDDNTYGRSR